MSQPQAADFEDATCDALLGAVEALKALRDVAADVRAHQQLASAAVSAWALPEGYSQALQLHLNAHGLVAKIDAALADLQPRIVALVAADAQRDRAKNNVTIN